MGTLEGFPNPPPTMLDDLLLKKLAAVELRYEELSSKLSDPAVIANRQSMQKLSKEHADLRELIEVLREHREIVKRVTEARELQKDPGDAGPGAPGGERAAGRRRSSWSSA